MPKTNFKDAGQPRQQDDPLPRLRQIVAELEDAKAQEIKILDLRAHGGYADFLAFATGSSERHLRAMADRLYLKLKHAMHLLPLGIEGYEAGQWILLDYGEIVVHLFLTETRQQYRLEELWPQAPAVGSVESLESPLLPSTTESPSPAVASRPRKGSSAANRPAARRKSPAVGTES